MQDMSMQAVDRTVLSSISVLTAAVHRAEGMKEQALADDLHQVLADLKRISAGIGRSGQQYKPRSTSVRI